MDNRWYIGCCTFECKLVPALTHADFGVDGVWRLSQMLSKCYEFWKRLLLFMKVMVALMMLKFSAKERE